MSQSQAATIADLRQQLAAAEAERQHVRELWFPWPGHPAGEHFGVSAHTLDGESWALRQTFAYGPVFVWTGDHWQALPTVHHADAYQWTRPEVLELGPRLAAAEAELHPLAEQTSLAELADEIDDLIALSRSVFAQVGTEPA